MSTIKPQTLEDHLALVKSARENLTTAEKEYIASIKNCMLFKKEQSDNATQSEMDGEVKMVLAQAEREECNPVTVIQRGLLEARSVLDLLAVPYNYYGPGGYLAKERAEDIICGEFDPACSGVRYAICSHLGIKNFQ